MYKENICTPTNDMNVTQRHTMGAYTESTRRYSNAHALSTAFN